MVRGGDERKGHCVEHELRGSGWGWVGLRGEAAVC